MENSTSKYKFYSYSLFGRYKCFTFGDRRQEKFNFQRKFPALSFFSHGKIVRSAGILTVLVRYVLALAYGTLSATN